MTDQAQLCTVDEPLVDHVQQLLADAGIGSRVVVDEGGAKRTILVPPERLEHAQSVIGLVLPHLLEGQTGTRLSDRLIRTEYDPPVLPGGLLDARPTHGYTDPLAEPVDDEDDAEYVPPEPPPLPRPRDRIDMAAWLGLVGGPLLLVAVQLLGLPGFLTPLALVAFFGGFIALVVRMEERSGKDDGWDDGAVV